MTPIRRCLLALGASAALAAPAAAQPLFWSTQAAPVEETQAMREQVLATPLLSRILVVGGADRLRFLQAITTRKDAWTTIVSPSGEGMSLTYRRRQN